MRERSRSFEIWSRVGLYGCGIAVAVGIIAWGAHRADQASPPVEYDVLDEIEIRKRIFEGDFDGGLELALDLCERHTDSARPFLLAGLAYERKGDESSAVASYSRAVPLVESAAQRRDVLLSIADLHRRLDDYATADAVYLDAIKELGESSRSLRFRVLVLCDQQRYDDALSEIRRVAEEVEEPELASTLRRHVSALRSGGGDD